MKIQTSLPSAFTLLAALVLVSCMGSPPAGFSQPSATNSPAQLTAAQIDRIGRRIWQNECAGTVEGLTSWNQGEDFASLGIGHFIWYPQSRRGRFEESFPGLMQHLNRRGISTAPWMHESCPWDSRAAFVADRNGPRQQELRRLLSSTVGLQTEFIMLRSRAALPKMLAAAGANADRVRYHYDLLSATPEGAFALIDYVNFKGEGTSPAERYQGQGWGLLQVLETMSASSPQTAPAAFADAASAVLARRVRHSPPERDESRWLAGWQNRCQAYKRPL